MTPFYDRVQEGQRFVANETGATMVEFALVLMPFLLIVIALLDFGYRGYVGIVADSVAHRMAREATTGEVSVNELEDRAVALIGPLLLRQADVEFETRSYFDFTGVGRPELITRDGDKNGWVDESDCWVDENGNEAHDTDVGSAGIGGADDAVVYEIDITSPNLTALASILNVKSEFRVHAAATGRNQPYEDQATVETQEYCILAGKAVAV